MSKPLTFRIPEANLDELAARLEKLNRRASKLGVPVLDSNVVAVEIRKETRFNDEGELVIVPGRVTRYYHVALIGEALKLPGWEFLGTLEHTPAGNVTRAVPGAEIPELYRTSPPLCDHCQKHRQRKDTYLVRKPETGEIVQLGHSCIRDFLGHITPERLGWLATLIEQIGDCCDDSDGFGGGGFGKRIIWGREWIEVCAALTLERGFIPQTLALETTKLRALRIMFPTKEMIRERTVPTVEITDEAVELARAATDWALMQRKSANSYLYNLSLLVTKELLDDRDLGLLASLPAAYRKAALGIERAKAAPKPVSEYFGAVGERKIFKLKVRKIVPLPGFRENQIRGMYLMEDALGNTAVWFASGGARLLDEGETYEIKATVKAHDEYKGVKQTVLTRCQIAEKTINEGATNA